ncbi:MAG: carbamoyltransferase HypF [Sulfuricurvum sp.]|uniref:carbamoyltransferase HypF n=1 Tax=Sulfuricurvum sp. TaxID=2025608 RepID=UPI0026053B75|nr:carbamoyltransferase HypF [Sulfuricurvum sp.]MDD2829997.1 carbamoyltransferase HypF [Sulfuricurvum sp.]MDD4948396.1 carbamoyltransferase HypF [Sulfuricurvum sp.]
MSEQSDNVRIIIRGIVQGVGFRPFVYREATRYGIRGFVCNTPEGVVIEAHGMQCESFIKALRENLPDRARIDSMEIEACEFTPFSDFEIRESTLGFGSVAIPLDTALCSACQAEMDDPLNRRYRYPFINCTDCGPRYTIIQTPPYDRVRTSMKHFTMCPECLEEYNNPTSRRYHAEPISCPKCGPQLKFLDNKGIEIAGNPIDLAVRLLKEGKIIALKGLGGFHLMCDATNDETVAELRRRKHRKAKPLAVMFGSIEQLETYVSINEVERNHITGSIKPIVIVDAQAGTNLSPQIAPHIQRLGVFLPYTPLHRLLFEQIDFPLVATSANISDEPIMIRSSEILNRLSHVVDGILDHDRTIINALDDAVIQIAEDRVVMLRLGRGFAPHTFALQHPSDKAVLALGAHQKSAIALGVKENMVLSGHIGDLGSVEADGYFERTVQTFKRFYDVEPSVLVHDLHPQYASSVFVVSQKKEHYGLQHHYAHILACMAEYALSEKVLGFAYDGTGYGSDGSLWGGEVMIADTHGYERVGHLKPFALLGGDKAIKEPRRIALSLLFESYSLDEVMSLKSPTVEAFLPHEIRTLHHMWLKNINAPRSSSMGRLFDAVASLGGFVQSLDYEGQGGMMMESFVEDSITGAFAFEVKDGMIDLSPMVREIISLEGDKTQIASRFISTVEAIMSYYADQYPALSIVVGGGVFQNRALMARLYRRFGAGRFYAQQQTPINDGSIALGQLYYAIHNAEKSFS